MFKNFAHERMLMHVYICKTNTLMRIRVQCTVYSVQCTVYSTYTAPGTTVQLCHTKERVNLINNDFNELMINASLDECSMPVYSYYILCGHLCRLRQGWP